MDIIELSDEEDKNETISVKSDRSEDNLASDISAILKKYENYNNEGVKVNNDISPEASDEETYKFDYDLIKDRLKRINELSPSPSLVETISYENLEFNEQPKNVPKGKKRKSDNQEKQLEKIRKEQEKIQKREEKERQKIAIAEAKAQKMAMAAAFKNIKPEECIKFITANIDSELMTSECGAEIPICLQMAEVKFKIKSQLVPNVITWCKDNQAQLLGNNGLLSLSTQKDECEELLLVMLWNEFVDCVSNKNLCEQLTIKTSLYPEKRLTLIIYGLAGYTRFQKNKKTQAKRDQMYANAPKVGRKEIEMALTEVQILMGISHKFIDNPKDIGTLIAQFTKSIAQIPYKLQKQQKYQQMNWYVAGCNKDCVRIDRSGNGLMRLWRQQLTQFALARLETAEAICSKYPSPALLMKAYDDCPTQKEAEKLLQDLPIRRAAGPLSSVRKLGPELSKKVYKVFNNIDGNEIL